MTTDDSARAGSDVPVRVALLNDHEIVVRGLESMLAPYQDRVRVVELVAGAHDPSVEADVALYDTFSVTQADGDEIEDVLQNPNVRCVVVYSWNLQADLVKAALDKGVRGYVSKSLGGLELVSALERAAAGEQVVLPGTEVDANESAEVVGGDWPGREYGLTARQAEVVSLITQGLSNEEIAKRTYLTMNTVKSYIRGAYRRMGVSSRTQAVLWGLEHDMLPDISRIRREPTG